MTLPAAWSLQVGLRAHLSADLDLATLLGTPSRLYDRVPDDAVFPLLTLGESRISPLDGDVKGMVHDVRINAFSRWGGRKEVRLLTDHLHTALHDRTFPIEGYRVVSSRFVFADLFRRPDGDTYQAVSRYRIVTSVA
ncbi:gene transfer agent-like protein [Parvularcula bermudensis HTCC2503]|uniref:Gene transfer agent-like protein n=1 Tax=Parvularcula bermudensis (strain ATCC BAA-594 / HTCC2503 / KCTC 12087) TaxID=314260 RepID=E0THR7_PARBH|nr:DUF3168 domain-containing protein [Parvularcula bermudensis]ADM09674.1 gene transfer agent-like protein [Parvularcula bermudensis HTCC2503]